MHEIRYAKGKLDGGKVGGYAALWNTPSQTLHERGRTFTEVIRPGAFTRSLQYGSQDIKLLWQHQGNQILARTRNGSLVLREDDKGLAFEATLPDTTLGRDARELLATGLVGEMSFGFNVRKDEWSQGYSRRELIDVSLGEVSLVIDAAYPQTTAALRSMADDNWADRIRIRIARTKTNG